MIKKIILLLIISAFVLSACNQQPAIGDDLVGGGSPVVQEMPAPDVEPDSVDEMIVEDVEDPDEETTETEGLKTVEISMIARNWEFEPNVIEVNEGDTVKLTITSEDVTHGFAIREYGISERLTPGKTITVEFVADKAGDFTTFCNVACGRGHSNMKGQLIVN